MGHCIKGFRLGRLPSLRGWWQRLERKRKKKEKKTSLYNHRSDLVSDADLELRGLAIDSTHCKLCIDIGYADTGYSGPVLDY